MANYGLSINEDYVALASYSDGKVYSFPTYICKLKNEESFIIGEEAYKLRLSGEAIGVDKLFNLALRNTQATLYETTYDANDLLIEFFKLIFAKFTDIDLLCIASYDSSTVVLNYLNKLFDNLRMYVPNYRVTTYEEALSYYSIMQKDQDCYAFIELDDQVLSFYEAKFFKKNSKDILLVQKKPNSEVFSLDILDEDAGKKIADNILLGFAKDNLDDKNFSHVFLIGKGFEIKDQFKNFMNYICLKNKVKDDIYAVAIGASYKAHDIFNNNKIVSKYRILNDSRLRTTVYFDAMNNGEEIQQVVASAGDEWFLRQESFYVLVDNCDEISIHTQSVNQKKPENRKYPLNVDPMRPNKATRLLLQWTFSEIQKIDLEIKDLGFGEFYKPKERPYVYEIEL